MENIIYRLGRISLDSEKIRFLGENPYDASHKFIVEHLINSLRRDEGLNICIHVSPASCHDELRNLVGISREKVIGGGSVYLDQKDNLFIGDRSGNYGAIPLLVAENFGLKLKEKIKIKIGSIEAHPNDSQLNQFWINLGFKQREPEQYRIDNMFDW